MDRQKIVIMILAVSLIFVLNYYLLDSYFKQNQKQIEEVFLLGRDQGIKEAITILYNQTENCNEVPIFIENFSKKIVDVNCVKSDYNLKP